MFKLTNLVLFIVVFELIQLSECNIALRKALIEYQVIPDVINTVPPYLIHIKYGCFDVKLGNELTPTEVRAFPSFFSFPFKYNKLYTIAMIDPDAPSRKSPTLAELKHFLAVNVPGNHVFRGDILAEYIGSGPAPNCGYVWLVYEQPGRINPTEKKISNRTFEGRPNFSIRNFAKKYNLGNPIAANFFQAKYDSSVPALYQQLGIPLVPC